MRLAWILAMAGAAGAGEMPRFEWRNFTTAQGLPDNRVYSVCVDGSRVWAGTDNGLGLYENGKWRVFRPEDGLAHRAVLYVTMDKQ
ncbi:MAG TPA: two-component regulator propeller domain-containing protein, partial [Bryobacteraceae bacterium]|nr:two-component regulator propeller domain-containing protein [Bryobacteraceae bacterium]